MEQNYKKLLGNVNIIKSESGLRNSYTPHYFSEEESLCNIIEENSILEFRNVRAIDYNEQIGHLCEQASNKEISESELITKLNELLKK